MGDTPHSIVLQSLLMELGIRAKAWNIRVLPMHRVEVAEGRWQLPDVCVVVRDKPLHDALRMPPLFCVEIVSPDDGLSEMHEKIAQYIDAGVKVVWIVDPRLKKAYETTDGHNVASVTQLTVPGTDILVMIDQVFQALHEIDPSAYLASVLNDEG